MLFWGATVTLVLLGALGLGYRYLAFHWWPEWVVRTTPSLEHLIDCRMESDGAITDLVDWRLRGEQFARTEVFERLERRILRSESEQNATNLAAMISEVDGLSESEKSHRWELLMSMSERSVVRQNPSYLAHIMLELYEAKPGQVENLCELWLRDAFTTTNLYTNPFGENNNKDCFAMLLRSGNVAIIAQICSHWSTWNTNESERMEVHVRACTRDEVFSYRPALLAAPLQWACSTTSAISARPDSEAFAFEMSTLRPDLESALWIGLSRRNDTGVCDLMVRERERWFSILQYGDDDAQMAVLMLLGNTEQHQYLSDVVPFLGHTSVGVRRVAIVSIVQFGDPADMAMFLPLIEDRECAQTVCRAIEALDDGRAQALIEAGMAASANPDAWRMALDVVTFPEAEAVIPIP